MNPHSHRNPDPNTGQERNIDLIDQDHDIARILTALGTVQPPPHLERRVLETLQHRAQPASRFPHWITSLSSPSRIRAWTLGLSTATIVLAGLALSMHQPGGPTSTAGGPTALPSPASNPVILSEGSRSFIARAAVEGPRSSPRHPSLQTLSSRELQNPLQSRTHLRILLCDCDPTALAEANAPSLPAPPLPLTEQERLLLRIAHHPDPVEVAELDPLQREASIAREQADYKHFFHPPTPSQPTPPTQPAPAIQAALFPEAAPPPQQEISTPAPDGDQP